MNIYLFLPGHVAVIRALLYCSYFHPMKRAITVRMNVWGDRVLIENLQIGKFCTEIVARIDAPAVAGARLTRPGCAEKKPQDPRREKWPTSAYIVGDTSGRLEDGDRTTHQARL